VEEEMTKEEILEMAKKCGAMKHYFRDELLTFARLIENQVLDELKGQLAACEKERDKYRKQVQLGFKHLIETECIGEVSINEGYTLVEHLRLQIVKLLKERDHWKANHANRVAASRVLIDRTDLPFERVRAYEKYVEMQEMFAECQQYLKDDETPAERMARYHHDIQGLLWQLATAKEQADKLREALWDIANPIAAMGRDVPKGYGFNGQLAIAIAEKSDYYINKAKEALSRQDLNACPNCGGEADQGHDRCYPPTAYLCSKCQSTTEDCSAVQAKG
jgi:hypothetical protein